MVDHDWVDRYWDDGFAFVRGVFTPAEAAELGGYFDEILAQAAGMREITRNGLSELRVVPIAGVPRLKFVKWAASFHAGLNRFRTNPKLLALAFTLLGPDLRQITNQMHWKNPGDEVSFQMHQDCTFRKPDTAYRNLPRSFIQTAIAVDASHAANGCIQFIPRSQRAARQLLGGGYEGWEGNSANRLVLENLPPPVHALLEPGDVALWSAYTIHGSQPNHSSTSRRMYINGFARAADCDHGIPITTGGRVLPLAWGAETAWDIVEER